MDKTMRRGRRLATMTTLRMIPTVALGLLMVATFPRLAAAQYVFHSFDVDLPDKVDTFADGLSTHEIVGEFTDSAGNTHGFMLNRGAFTSFDAPGADGYTSVNGVNARGDHCGIYFVDGQSRAYLLDKAGGFTPLNHPVEFSSFAFSLNAKGQVVGYYVDATRTRRGFIWRDGVFTPVDVNLPDLGRGGTGVVGINDPGDIVGFYGDTNHHFQGFLRSGGVYTRIHPPEASDDDSDTFAQGVNNAGDIVGYYTNGDGPSHGFLLRDGVYTIVDVPEAIDAPGHLGAQIYGINAKGEIVGAFEDADGIHGFLGTPARGPQGR